MKKFCISLLILFCSSCLFAQIYTANEAKMVFSPKNLAANRIEFPVEELLTEAGYDFALATGSIATMTVQKGQQTFECAFNENGALEVVSPNGISLVYNTNGQVEIVNLGSKIIAITYDKKGRVASEARLYPIENEAVSLPAKQKNYIAGDYIFTDAWVHTTNDSIPKIYLQEIRNEGKNVQNWAIETMFLYKYNGQGLMTEKIISASNYARNAIYKFTYNGGQLQQQIKTYSNTAMVESSTYFYDNGLLVKVNKGFFKAARKNPPLISSETTTLQYDSAGNLTEYTSYDGYRYDFCLMQYDAENRIVKVQKKQEDGTLIPMFQCEYDANGSVTKCVAARTKLQIATEYDEAGNWTSRSVTKNGATNTVSRSITYKK